MSGERNEVRHDAASLHQFVSSIADLTERRNPARAYLTSSETFFAYISALAKATRTYVENWRLGRTDPLDLLNLRNEIATLRAGWMFLHGFIKPALDADTLRLPTALIDGLIRRFREIPAFSGTDFVIYHTDEFNYLQVRLTRFKDIADRIAILVKGPAFPDALGLIGIPYSQSTSLFMNCLIPHEMGHYVFGHFKLRTKFLPKIDDDLKKRLGTKIDALGRSFIAGIVVKWTEEMFCDLFALTLIGPCYSLAYIELFDVAKVLDKDGKVPVGHYPASAEFTDSYPPDLFRMRQQFVLSKTLGWWDELRSTRSHYIKCFEAVGGLSDSDFTFPGLADFFNSSAVVDADTVLACFFSNLPDILTEVEAAVHGAESGIKTWHDQHKPIRSFLEHSVVPSTLSIDENGRIAFPSLVSLLNSTYTFYLEALDDLMSHMERTDPDNVAQRANWAVKLQSWTAKAIEDVGLLQKRKT